MVMRTRTKNHLYDYMDRQPVRPNKAHSSPGLSGILCYQNGTTAPGIGLFPWSPVFPALSGYCGVVYPLA